ncbi:hypothetical protein DPM33_00350 [Mesorhizobium hawassense]|uniref:Uncharacterized protein n=1 Tax=Mesorhizobium hawassense TaxID=1209954 RepID=A0A330HXW2_9HYPH|nr:hypothetical protein DPM33_00350 [Mesorhizobium hawassense]
MEPYGVLRHPRASRVLALLCGLLALCRLPVLLIGNASDMHFGVIGRQARYFSTDGTKMPVPRRDDENATLDVDSISHSCAFC